VLEVFSGKGRIPGSSFGPIFDDRLQRGCPAVKGMARRFLPPFRPQPPKRFRARRAVPPCAVWRQTRKRVQVYEVGGNSRCPTWGMDFSSSPARRSTAGLQPDLGRSTWARRIAIGRADRRVAGRGATRHDLSHRDTETISGATLLLSPGSHGHAKITRLFPALAPPPRLRPASRQERSSLPELPMFHGP